MRVNELLWWWLVHATVLSGLVLIAGCLAVAITRQPADRLRIIQWIMASCLIAPFLPGLISWEVLSFDLVQPQVVANSSNERQVSVVNNSLTPAIMMHNQPTAARLQAPAIDDQRALMQQDARAQSNQPVPIATLRADPATSRMRTFANLAVIAYVAVLLSIGLLWLAGILQRRRLERGAAAASQELQAAYARMSGPGGRPVRLLISDRIEGPITWGLFHPVIIVPAQLAVAPHDPRLRWCLAHELSHVENRDVGTLLLASVVQLVCFCQPLYWWLRRQMVLCQDYIADARAARETGSVEDYAEFLVQLAGKRMQPRFAASLGIIDRKSRLFRRVKMLVAPRLPIHSQCRPATSLLIAIGAIAILALLSTIKLDAAESDAARGQPATQAVQTKTNDLGVPEVGVVQGSLLRATDKSPVAGARVILRGGQASYAESDIDGRFRFENVPNGPRRYEVWAHQENLITAKTPIQQLQTALSNYSHVQCVN